jgi:hypothetical protein
MTTSEPLPTAPDLRFGSLTVLDALQLGLIDCPADADIRTVARTMAAHAVHCVVVRGSDPDGWGIVSDLDLMAALGSSLPAPPPASWPRPTRSSWIRSTPSSTRRS